MSALKRKASPKTPRFPRSDNDLRHLVLKYFYERNKNATSERGKKGSAIKISDIKRELKQNHGLTQQEVMSNLHYLKSQGWIAKEEIHKSVPLPSGTIIPQATSFYSITAAGIDKIDGPGEFTIDKFRGIKVEATGQNIITIGDGNQVNAEFRDAAGALVDLKRAVLQAESISEAEKLNLVADIDSIESQLAKAKPSRSVIQGAWESVKVLDTALGLSEKISNVAGLLGQFL